MKTRVIALFLEKLARHLALLACLAIAGKAAGWTDPGQPAILFLIILAAAAHWGGRLSSGVRREPPSR